MTPLRPGALQIQALARHLLPPLFLIAVFALAQCLHQVHDLAYKRDDIASGALWQLLSAHLVHNNTAHLLLNAAGLSIVWFIAGPVYSGLRFILLSLIIALVTGALLYFGEPQLHYYLGFSGALHGVLAAVALHQMARGLGTGYLLGTALLLKLAWEYGAADASAATATLIGLRVATEAHAWGAVSGLLVALLSIARTLTTKRSHP